MTRSVYANTLEFPLQASRWLRCYLLVLSSLIIVAIWLLPGSVLINSGASLLVVVMAAWLLRKVRSQPNTILIADEDHWRIQCAGQSQSVELGGPIYSSPWLVILPVKLEGRTKRLVIPADSLDADQHRRLRVLLNHPRN